MITRWIALLILVLVPSSLSAQWFGTRSELWDSVITPGIVAGSRVTVAHIGDTSVQYRVAPIGGVRLLDTTWGILAEAPETSEALRFLYYFRPVSTRKEFYYTVDLLTNRYGMPHSILRDSNLVKPEPTDRIYFWELTEQSLLLSVFYQLEDATRLVVICVNNHRND